MFNLDLEIEKAYPINIKELEVDNFKLDENIKKSIILYNIAIGDIKKNNFILATNDLNNALTYNKDFAEAIKLLGLCYANIRDFKKAEKTFRNLNKYKIYDELVKEFMENLIFEKSSTNKRGKRTNKNKYKHDVTFSKLKRNIILALLISLIIVFGISIKYYNKNLVIAVENKFQANTEKNNIYKNETHNIEENTFSSNNSSEINTINNDKNQDAEINTKVNQSSSGDYKNETSNMLIKAQISLNNGNYEELASTLINIKNRNLDDEAKIKFNELWSKLDNNVFWSIYNQGNSLYKQNKYEQALIKLKIAYEINPNLDIMPWLTFQIGMCYKESSNKDDAVFYFNKVKNEYPKSKYVSNAQTMINQISN